MIEGIPTEEQLWLLAKVNILASLSLEEIERLALLSASVYLGTGETFALDEGCQALLLLATGRVRVHEPNTTGPGLTISMVEEPTVVTGTGFSAQSSRAVVRGESDPAWPVIRLLEKLRLAEVLTKVDEGWEVHCRRIPRTKIDPAAGITVAAKNAAKG